MVGEEASPKAFVLVVNRPGDLGGSVTCPSRKEGELPGPPDLRDVVGDLLMLLGLKPSDRGDSGEWRLMMVGGE